MCTVFATYSCGNALKKKEAFATLIIDRHLIAGISIAGTVCDVMGGLYLAYDLLGGKQWAAADADPHCDV